MNPELKSKLAEVKEELPARLRYVEDMERLLKLAEQSPYAAANYDFLARVKMETEKRRGECEMVQLMVKV